MKYDFDEIIPRRGSNSYKWDSKHDNFLLPMWVADMDFRTAQPIIDRLEKRVRHGIFGYAKVPDSYYEALIFWFLKHYDFNIRKEWILYTSGVVPALSAVIKALTSPGDKVIVQEPVYNCFFSSIRNNGCETVSNDLIYENGCYTIDFDDLEAKACDPKARVMLLCNPHNPVGRVWTAEELTRIGEICIKHQVKIISDEIHCDLVHPGFKHIPFASLNHDFLQHSVTCTAPSKTFNLAGIQVANILAPDEEIRRKIDKALNINEVCEINVFAIEALIAAYDEGEEWLIQLKEYLYQNYQFLKTFINTNLPRLKVLPLEATYLAWIDCKTLGIPSSGIAQLLLEKEKVWVNEGTLYGDNGEGFIRLNIACPRQLLSDGLTAIKNIFG